MEYGKRCPCKVDHRKVKLRCSLCGHFKERTKRCQFYEILTASVVAQKR
jgi:hypothetical protein